MIKEIIEKQGSTDYLLSPLCFNINYNCKFGLHFPKHGRKGGYAGCQHYLFSLFSYAGVSSPLITFPLKANFPHLYNKTSQWLSQCFQQLLFACFVRFHLDRSCNS